MIVYLAGPVSLKKSEPLFMVSTSGRAGKFEKRGKKLYTIYLSGRARKLKRGKVLFYVVSSHRARSLREAKCCLFFVFPAEPGSLKSST